MDLTANILIPKKSPNLYTWSSFRSSPNSSHMGKITDAMSCFVLESFSSGTLISGPQTWQHTLVRKSCWKGRAPCAQRNRLWCLWKCYPHELVWALSSPPRALPSVLMSFSPGSEFHCAQVEKLLTLDFITELSENVYTGLDPGNSAPWCLHDFKRSLQRETVTALRSSQLPVAGQTHNILRWHF